MYMERCVFKMAFFHGIISAFSIVSIFCIKTKYSTVFTVFWRKSRYIICNLLKRLDKKVLV